MTAGSPLEGPVWCDLRQALTAFTRALPSEVAGWVRLGEAVAASLGPGPDDDRMRGVALLQLRLSEMQPQPLLDGVTSGPGVLSIEQVEEYHRQILDRLQEGERPAGAGLAPPLPTQEPPPPANSGSTLPGDISKQARALGLLGDHPEMTDAEIAKRVGCSRTSLYRMQRFVQAKEALRGARQSYPRAIKTRDRAGNPSTDGVYDRRPGKNDEE
jgi:hypothetical protein